MGYRVIAGQDHTQEAQRGIAMILKSTIGELGQIVITRGLNSAIEQSQEAHAEVMDALRRYMLGEWGDLGAEDKEMNDNAVRNPKSDRILARYNLECGSIYIITEWDRSYTTLMFCEEY